jgi:formimidoylglutamate deiminase
MTSYFANTALLPEGWVNDVLISVDDNGWISDINIGRTKHDRKDTTVLSGPLIPAMPNIHSHAFQRAMAGLTEYRTSDSDSFWSWRKLMYSFLDKLQPEDIEAIATQLYVEMLKAGYSSVGEFHYLHHDINGSPYDDKALTSRHIIKAAENAGIAITHMPVLYAYGGFGNKKPDEGQKRFINDTDSILSIINSLRGSYDNNPQINIGLAHHSLRAVSPEMLKNSTDDAGNGCPVHIHIAEQIKEVDDCKAWSGKRPVEWLLENMDVNERWCLIHATHMTENESSALAKTGAVAGLCPTTEANLGDGIFNLPQYISCEGKIGIGSDSHISVNMIEELRWLEYGQRLNRKERVVMTSDTQPHNGREIYEAVLSGGAQALDKKTGRIEKGCRADFIAIDMDNPVLAEKSSDQLLDAMIFATNQNPVKDVIAGGKHVIKNYRHEKEAEIFEKFKSVIAKIT